MPSTAEFLESHLTERGVLRALSKMTGSPPAKLRKIGPRRIAIHLEQPPMIRRKAAKARGGAKAYKKKGVKRKAVKKTAASEHPMRGKVNKALRKLICGNTGQALLKGNMTQSAILSTIGTYIAGQAAIRRW